MSMLIQVRRLRNTISYIPQRLVWALPEDANIISVIDEGDRRPTFLETQNVLPLETGLHGIEGSHLKAAMDFLAAYHGQNIYIHCYMGEIRSKTLAQNMALRSPGYKVLKHSVDCVLYEHVKE